MNKKLKPLLEYFSESTTACLFTMVQGNILSLTLIHLSVAAQTGLFAGGTAFIMLYVTKLRNRWFIALLLGTVTAVVDLIIHPGMFGSYATEAIVTGAGAGMLSLIIGYTIDFFVKKNKTE